MKLAQITNPVISDDISGFTGSQYLSNILPRLVVGGFIAGVIIFFFVFLFGAIEWISSGGDKGRVEAARGKIANALIGLVIMFALYAVLQLLGGLFGVNLLELDLSTIFLDPGDPICVTTPCGI